MAKTTTTTTRENMNSPFARADGIQKLNELMIKVHTTVLILIGKKNSENIIGLNNGKAIIWICYSH